MHASVNGFVPRHRLCSREQNCYNMSVVFLCSDISNACQILQLPNKYFTYQLTTLCYSSLVSDCTVNDMARNHWLRHTKSEQGNTTNTWLIAPDMVIGCIFECLERAECLLSNFCKVSGCWSLARRVKVSSFKKREER